MAKGKRAAARKKRGKVKPTLEPIGKDKVRLTMEFTIEELVRKMTSPKYDLFHCGCDPPDRRRRKR